MDLSCIRWWEKIGRFGWFEDGLGWERRDVGEYGILGSWSWGLVWKWKRIVK